ncbi:MAG: phosphatase PAP2 family protein [Clostridiales bacterium]|jgi:undecaprenyl-diphosphatase|nr:phosphatase PAP2 family protein [Clostridiales bacterium]
MGATLDSLFYGFDTALYNVIWHLQNPATIFIADVCQQMGNMRAYIIYGVLSLILIIPKKTRKYGVALFIAFAAGTLLVNYGIKPAIDRARPYITLKDTPFWDVFNTYWTAAGAHLESDPSFPSGHTSTNFEMFTALTGMLRIDGHKWAWFFMIIPIIVAISRIIRCVHYPSDVIAGMICGLITGLLGIGISYLIFCRKKKTA